MHRIVVAAFALALGATLVPTAPALAGPRCGFHHHWVPGHYKWWNGRRHWIPGHCS